MDMMVIPNRGKVVAVISALALAGGLLTLALLAKPTQAQDRGATSERIPVAFTLDATECQGELIDLTGTIHTVNHFTQQEDGTYHITGQFNLAGAKAVGQTTGEEYVVPSASQAVELFVSPGQTINPTVSMNLVIGKGQVDNLVATAQIHYIVNDDGTVKVEIIQYQFECHQ
jgi:hypothetical protein